MNSKDFQPYIKISPQFKDAFQHFLEANFPEHDDEVLLGAVDCCESYFGRVLDRYFRCGILVFTNHAYWFAYRYDLGDRATTYYRTGTPIHVFFDRPYQRRKWVEVPYAFAADEQVPLSDVAKRSYRDIYLLLGVEKYVLPKTAVHLLELQMSICRYPVRDELYLAFHEEDDDFIAKILFASHHVHAGNFRDAPFITQWPPADADPDQLLDWVKSAYYWEL
jgi:hypothetical protein